LKKISVQTGTRGRANRLPGFVDNIFDKAKNPSDVEIIFYIDNDDKPSQNMVKNLPVQCVIGPRGNGYWDYPRWHTEMAKFAEGQLLIQANDDMEILTKGWDELLWQISEQYPDHIYNLKMCNISNPTTTPFPIIHRRVVDIMGCYCPYHIPWVDRFLQTVMTELDRWIWVDEVKTKHNRIIDTTMKDWMKSQKPEWDVKNRPKYQEEDVKDWVNKLREYIV